MNPNASGGHGPFSAEDVQQIMADTGYDYDRVCRDIDASGASTKEQLYPKLYSGEGIQPMTPAAAPAPAPAPAAAAPAGMQTPESAVPAGNPGAMPAPAPSDMQTAAPAMEQDTLPPEALEAMRASMAPPSQQPQNAQDPAWKRRLRERY